MRLVKIPAPDFSRLQYSIELDEAIRQSVYLELEILLSVLCC